jgi:hypothetical protein
VVSVEEVGRVEGNKGAVEDSKGKKRNGKRRKEKKNWV